MTDTGIWNEEEAQHHVTSMELAIKLMDVFQPNFPIIDMGCGTGDYIRFFRSQGYAALGVEGSDLPEHKGDHAIYHFDLTKPVPMSLYGQVMSLEVGEHIPEQYEQVFLDNITKDGVGVLILSWAVPGQAGIGHVNCKPQEYIISEVERRGPRYDAEGTRALRDGEYKTTPWFKDTLMMFRW